MAPLDEKAREEAVAKYIAKANEKTMQTLKRLEQEKDNEVRALKQRLADFLKANSNLVTTPATPSIIDATKNSADSWTVVTSLRQEIELQALKLEVEALKQHMAAIALQRAPPPPPAVAFSNDFYSSDSAAEVEVLRLRLAALQNSIPGLSGDDVLSANGFSPAGAGSDNNTADELKSLRLRLARLQNEVAKRIGHGQQQQQQQPKNPPGSPINNTPPGLAFQRNDNQSTTEIQTIRTQLDNLLKRAFGRGGGNDAG
jgi:hypothetical protein